MFDILSTFENIEIKNDNRLCEEDLNTCKQYQEKFNNIKDFILKQIEFTENQPKLKTTYYDENEDRYKYYNTYISTEYLINRLKEHLIKEAKTFNNALVSYFESKYKVDLYKVYYEKGKYEITDEDIENFDMFIDLNYDTVLEKIYSQLDGFDFQSKAKQEVKDNFKNQFKYSLDKYKINKNKLTFNDLYIISYDGIWKEYQISYYAENNAKAFINALNLFENNNTDKTELSNLFLNEYGVIKKEGVDELFSKCKLETFSKIKSLKFFKNGRVDIEFASSEICQQFKNEYLI